MTVTLTPTSRWADQPKGFNRAAAETVYKAIMALPDDDTAAIYGRIIVEGLVDRELLTKGHSLARAADARARTEGEKLRRGLSRAAVAKARAGEDASEELYGLAVLAKALDFTDSDRSRFARDQQRDLHSGRFVREHAKIGYDSDTKALDDKHRAQFGISSAPHLTKEDQARYQQAYVQLHRMIAPFTGMGDSALIHLHIHDANGPVRTDQVPMVSRGNSVNLAAHLEPGQHLDSASVSVVPPTTAAGASFDALSGISPTAAGVAYSTVNRGAGNPERLAQFREQTGREYEQDAYIPSQRVFRNLESGSKLLSDSLGDSAPRKVRYALAVGEHVGRYGPEAQKVVGPTADKAAYRYRGTERPLSERLTNALTQLRSTDGIRDKRWYLLHGNAKPDGSTPINEWRPSGVLQFFRDQLPSANLSTLHLKAGAVPPSRGVVFDKDGVAHAEAVGYGDDHYLPFNLRGKSFRSLKGGEYIRTRTFGGPTTEDFYAGLMGGAKGFAVVSHNGVFTVDFAPDLKGGKRFTDNAHRMVGRYGYLLDAVRSNQVTTGAIAPSRMAELRAKADAIHPQAVQPEQYQAELKRLTTAEAANPTLSAAQTQKATIDFFANDLPGGRGVGDTRQSMVASYVRDEATHRWTAETERIDGHNRHAPADAQRVPRSLESFQSQVRDELANTPVDQIGQRYADILGVRPQLDAAIATAAADNAASLTPLRLDGDGYLKAMQALQEEFPHYIADVQFHPWTSKRGPQDSGYVLPRHNRAAQALAGYFDSRLGGKVYADSTRFQNRRRTPIKVERERADAPERGDRPAKTGRDDEAARGTAAADREKADKDLAHAYLNAKTIGSQATNSHIEDPMGMRGYSISTLTGHENAQALMGGAAPNLFQMFKLGSPEAFDAAYAEDPEKWRGVLAGARTENQKLHWIDDVHEHEEAFARGGKPAPKRQLGEHASDALDHAGQDHDFDAPAYESAMRPTADAVARTYGAEDSVQRLVGSGNLPAEVGHPDLPGRASDLVDALKTQRDALRQRARNGEILRPGDWAGVDQRSEGVVRALQLRRRHDEAKGAERDAAVQAAPEQPSVSYQNRFEAPLKDANESVEDWAARSGALAAEYKRRFEEQDAESYRRSPYDTGNVLDQ